MIKVRILTIYLTFILSGAVSADALFELENSHIASLNKRDIVRVLSNEEDYRNYVVQLERDIVEYKNGNSKKSLTSEHINFAIDLFEQPQLIKMLDSVDPTVIAGEDGFFPPIYTFVLYKKQDLVTHLWKHPDNRNFFRSHKLDPVVYALSLCHTEVVEALISVSEPGHYEQIVSTSNCYK